METLIRWISLAKRIEEKLILKGNGVGYLNKKNKIIFNKTKDRAKYLVRGKNIKIKNKMWIIFILY